MKDLVAKLVADGALKHKPIVQAFLQNDRKLFVAENFRASAYLDMALPIGLGQTISQPYTVAFMMELLDPKPGQKILDVGFGSGWTTAILASIVGKAGKVIGLEIVPEIFELGKQNLARFAYPNLELYNSSGWKGHPREAPYDRILVSAVAEEVPKALRDELAVGGKMVIPVGKMQDATLTVLDRVSASTFKESKYPGFAFVPLVKK